MVQPTPYAPTYSFTDHASGSPSAQPPGVPLDIEFDNISSTVQQIIDNLAKIQRDDTTLRSNSVGVNQLDGAALALLQNGTFDVKGVWQAGQSYALGDFVAVDDLIYVVVIPHTSGVFATDLAANKLVRAFNPETVVPPVIIPSTAFATLAELKAADPVLLSYTLTEPSLAGVFFYETANAPYIADNVNTIKLDNTALSVGALVRQSAAGVSSNDGAGGSLWTNISGFVSRLLSSAGSSVMGFLQAGIGAVARTAQAKLRETLSVLDFGATGNGVTNDAPAIQLAVNAALTQNKRLYFPAGNYLCTTGIVIESGAYATTVPGFGVFAPSVWMYGDGPLKTKLISSFSGYLFTIDSIVDHATTFKALHTTTIEQMSLEKAAGATGTSGISIQTSYHNTFRNLVITGFNNDGIKFICDFGDNDGAVYTTIQDVDVHNCGRWGIDIFGGTDRNEISFVSMRHVWLQANGTPAAFNATITPGVNEPTSGGLRYKGQNIKIEECGFTVNNNVALLGIGGPGLASSVIIEGTAFENCIDRAVLITGNRDVTVRDSHLYANSTYVCKIGFETVGTSLPSRIVYEGHMTLRSAGSQCIAFKNTGPSSAATDKGAKFKAHLIYQDFFRANHTAFAGDWDFPVIPSHCELTTSGNTVTLAPTDRGSTVPLCRRYGGDSGGYGDTGYYEPYQLRVSGVTSSDQTGIPNGVYNVYFTDVGNIVGLEVSGAAPTTRFGQRVKAGEEGKVWVGRVAMVAGTLATGAAANFCNPGYVSGLGFLWTDSGGIVRRKTTLPTTDTDGTAV